MSRLLFVVLVLLLATPAAAEVRVMCYGDSLTAGSDESDPTNSYPGELQRLRPDLEVVNEGRDGDVSGNFARFEAAIAAWPPDVVVVMLGTNDAVCSASAAGCNTSPTPEESAANVLRMAEAAKSAGATKVFVLTPPPSVCKADCDTQNEVAYAMWMRDAFTGRLADTLRKSQPMRGVRVADLRRKLSDATWATLSSDGLHPSGEGNRMIARFIAAYIPHGGGSRTTVAERRPSSRREAKREAKRGPIPEENPFARKPQDRRYAQ